MAPQTDLPRLHALDGLRAAMMLLGLVLHSAVNYTVTALGEAWPYQDAQTNQVFDFVAFFIHLFRMPTFFVMAGFFAAFLYYRDGGTGFLKHRFRRILLPLAAAWIVMVPAVGAGFFFAHVRKSGWDAAVALVNNPAADNGPSLMHLWFLYYLLIFYVATVAAMPLLRRLPAAVRSVVERVFRASTPGFTSVLLLTVITTATLLPMRIPGLETSVSFVPPVHVLVAYVVFFAFGWLLFNCRDVVPAFGRAPWMYFGAGMGASVAYLSVVIPDRIDPVVRHYTAMPIAALATWLLIFACIGLFVRYFERPRAIQRYIADGSYWIYLVHLPFTIWIPGLLAPWPLPAVVKFLIVLGGTTLATVATYHYLVRSTWIGVFLNGRRYSRALPSAQAPVGAQIQM